MKNITKIIALAFIVLGFSASSFAQVTATAIATATIVTPIAISKTQDMNFGNISAGTGGTVTLATDGTRTKSGNVVLPAIGAGSTAAKFTVTGTDTYTYSISLPGTITLTNTTDNTKTMSIGTFISTPTTTGVLGTAGQELLVGAMLTVVGGQTPGLYTNTTDLTVTVNYN